MDPVRWGRAFKLVATAQLPPEVPPEHGKQAILPLAAQHVAGLGKGWRKNRREFALYLGICSCRSAEIERILRRGAGSGGEIGAKSVGIRLDWGRG